MKIKAIIEEDFVNYKKPSLFIAFPSCSFKCEKDSGVACCQNSDLAKSEDIEVTPFDLVKRYLSNPITQSIVCAGLEPFDTWDDLYYLVKVFRTQTSDDIVIYTGYEEHEIEDKVNYLKRYANIIIKFGRFKPNDKHRFDDVLGVELASENQYAKRI